MTETTDTPRYSTMDLEDAETFYHDEVMPQMRAEGLAPEHETPTLDDAFGSAREAGGQPDDR